MKIINRIMLSSALLVLLSLFSLLIVLGVIILLLPPENGGREMLDDKVYLAAQVIENYNPIIETPEALAEKLSQYSYNLLVVYEGSTKFSTLNDNQTDCIESLKSLTDDSNVLLGKIESFSFAAYSKESYSLYAVKDQSITANINHFSIATFSPFIGVALISIVIIMIFSQFFSRKLAQRFLQPLNAMSEGAKRIENGDLSEPVICTGKDEFAFVCTAFNHMQEHLMKEQEKNTAYEKSRTDLIAGISHDLRTPLTSVKGFIKGLRDGVANTPEKREQYLSIAYQKACDMDVLLQELFFFSNLETGNLPMAFNICDLVDFVNCFSDEMRDEFENRNIIVNITATSVPHLVKIDIEQMRRILFNLIENAKKYSGTEYLLITISIWRERGMEHLLFADNGQGVPENQLPYIFDQFWRSDVARSSKNKDGSGLGLYIVKYIIEAHGGFVTAKNNNGLAIEIMLPCGEEGKNE